MPTTMTRTWFRMVVTLVAKFKLPPKRSEILNVFCCCLETLLHMSLNPLRILKKSFAEFLGKIKERKDRLNVKSEAVPAQRRPRA